MKLKTIMMAGAMTMVTSTAWAACSFENTVPLKSLSAGFEAWKAVTDAMAECGNFSASLDQEFREKQPEAFAADPALYQIGGVSNATLVPLLNAGTIRPLDDLVAKYGQDLLPNQLIKVDGQTMAIAMMVNAQHLMYRSDVLADLGIEEPKTYDDVLAAAAKIKGAGVMDYPIGGTFKTGWNLGQEFVNMYLGEGGEFFADGNMPAINNDQGVKALETLKAMTEYMDPEYLVSDSTYVQQQFQQGKIAMANLWASRAAAMNDEAESQVVGKVVMAAAPMGSAAPATTIWWDGIVLASNMSDEEADAAFRVALEGMDAEMVEANNNAAVWLNPAYKPGDLAAGAAASAEAGAKAYPASGPMGIMHTALGNGLADYLTGAKDAQTTLADIEADYLTAAKEAGLVNN
ncbi:ABC transporter substrate-binding protein [Ruegeria arenilitoris]|uniref:Bacterial extracellular solute-binding protein n=1 Tax=Ruegeria arenilitoris TaxID=1173585 RepID=A0A238L3U3_9RHOB|nr:extracellular solute-binding protein [Ruegeria arenilitoris]SMX48996.1 Bacterial extracellular solute-binding protein [Ruegeria arenilitoris]